MDPKKIRSALISVFSKDGIDAIAKELDQLGVKIYSTGGTQQYIEKLGIDVISVEQLTSYPSILDGRVKTLHPKVFGGLLARREPEHLSQLENYDIPEIDLLVVDLYPFSETVARTSEESEIIEKIDIGGIALIRAAAKNFRDVIVVSSRKQYASLLHLLQQDGGYTEVETRRAFALQAFLQTSLYDKAIWDYFEKSTAAIDLEGDWDARHHLRYGENPHQEASFIGPMDEFVEQLNGKALSYNNIIDIDSAIQLMADFKDAPPTAAVIKHTNPCGLATRDKLPQAWDDALAGDNVSAFGGIIIANQPVDLATAQAIDKIFYEVLIAPDYFGDALDFLSRKKKRIILKIKDFKVRDRQFKSVLNGMLQQDTDTRAEGPADMNVVTKKSPSATEAEDLIFANKIVKHLKSNAISLAKGQQLVGIGCGQTSRVDALRQAIEKAERFGFDLKGAVMASDAFFPFPDCVEIADEAGITSVIQPGGSIRDQDSITYCDHHGMSMVCTGARHFKH